MPVGVHGCDGSFGVTFTPKTFFLTPPAPCPYLEGRTEQRIVALLDDLGPQALDFLTPAGFRRSQRFLYRPRCPGCESCVSVRIPVERFRWTRSFRKIRARNRDLVADVGPPRAIPEEYALFRRYLEARHDDGGMHGMRFDEYREMIEEAAPGTRLIRFRDGSGELRAASLTDQVSDGLSGVYKFFDPSEPRRSLGTHVVLWHVEQARRLGLRYVYLGYWISGCRKMEYKARFRPLERLVGSTWVPFEGTSPSSHLGT